MSGLLWQHKGMGGSLCLMFSVLFLGTLLTTLIWYTSDNSYVVPHRLPALKKAEKTAPTVSCDNCNDDSHVEPHKLPRQKNTKKKAPSDNCNGCSEVINQVLENYSENWTKQEDNYRNIRSQLRSRCDGSDKVILTQTNAPVGSNIVYNVEKKRVLKVTPEFFSTFIKESPFSNKIWETCAVVGNGGILADSKCGDEIDSTQFVIRCNLPPLEDGFKTDVGIKTDIVTANPTSFLNKYGPLTEQRRPFADSLQMYDYSIMIFSAFTIGVSTPPCLRAFYTIEDLGVPIQPAFLNPEYTNNLFKFWQSRGLKESRLSTGLIMASVALEICNNVHLYGFWPFDNHPHGFKPLTHHYYDDKTASKVHAMPAEFNLLLQLHSQGVLKVHLGQCGKH